MKDLYLSSVIIFNVPVIICGSLKAVPIYPMVGGRSKTFYGLRRDIITQTLVWLGLRNCKNITNKRKRASSSSRARVNTTLFDRRIYTNNNKQLYCEIV